MTQRVIHPRFRESHDSIGLGKLTENQMKGVIDLIKSRGLLKTPPPEPTGDRGIVIAAGGRYAPHGYANARLLRMKGIQHPIQIWHFPNEYSEREKKAFAKLDVEFVDAFKVREKHWHRSLKGWTIKHFSCAHAPWQHVVFYDADCFAAIDPSCVFDDPDYQSVGALFFSDVKPCRATDWAYVFASVRIPDAEMESGIFFWNRVKAHYGIAFTNWMGEHSEVWDRHIHGDKCRPYLAFGATDTPFIQSKECRWMGAGIEQSWKGIVLANHEMSAKRGEHRWVDPVIPGLFEEWRSLTS